MKTADLREKFIEYFSHKDHAHVESSPLVPGNDPTLLFTNSGMVQFKDVFLGFDKRPYDRAVTAQRCLRAGGKHNDLENVGYTARHHTFFEMLGNFSFGDYFKEKAIPYAWEFLTSPQWLGLDKQHMWITVFGGGKLFGEGTQAVPADEEAADIWRKTLVAAGFDEAEAKRRITYVPTTDNFWMMGETGPCGPCSEIFYDKDAAADRFRGEEEEHADECVEIWNLVFMQYNRDDEGVLNPLPAPCVDTGMGLERISAVMQGVNSNYDIDFFRDMLAAAKTVTETPAGAPTTPSHCVIADHIRAAAFLIADGIMPSNEGRGYVLRRIIRRALRHLHKANPAVQTPAFYRLVATLAQRMGKAYPVLLEKQTFIENTLKQEEEGFSQMLTNGIHILDAEIKKLRRGGAKVAQLPGDIVFKLYDTYGFPVDMTANIARDDYQMTIDDAGFETCMTEQRQRSRAAMNFNIKQQTVSYDGAATEFIGYGATDGEAQIAGLIVHNENVTEARPGDEVLIILNRTPFYAESGGQIGDTGVIRVNGSQASVADTQKLRADVWGHIAHIHGDALKVGDAVLCTVDAERRDNIAHAHSAAHLMHAALRRILGKHVQQRGSQVSDNLIRFDFSHPQAVSDEELRTVEAMVNQQICANAAVETTVMAYDEAIKTGAMALFGEKYGDRVRVVTIDEAFSIELCGGTHVQRAGDIGYFQFTGESAIAAGVRRVEAVTSQLAVHNAQQTKNRLNDLAQLLKTPVDRLEEKIAQMRDSIKAGQKELQELHTAQAAAMTAQLTAHAQTRDGVQYLIQSVNGADGKTLRDLAMQCRERLKPAAIFLAGDSGDKAAFAVAVSPDINLTANDWLKQAIADTGAKGGGKADFAQAGGGDVKKIAQALELAEQTGLPSSK